MSALSLVAAGKASAVAAAVYVVVYTVVVLFAFIRSRLEARYSWLVRPRFAVYAWILVESIWAPGWMNIVLWAANALLAIKLVSGFYVIRLRLPGSLERRRSLTGSPERAAGPTREESHANTSHPQ